MKKQKFTKLAKWMPLILSSPIICILVGILHLIERNKAESLISDVGIIQEATSFFIFIAFFFALYRSFREKERFFTWLEASYIIIIYALREMDWHRKFTPEHVTKLKYYLGDYPLIPRVISGFIMLMFCLAMLHLLLKNMKFFLKELTSFKTWTIYFMAWFIFLAGAQVMDKSFLNDIFIGRAFEECIELYASIIMCFVIVYFPLKK